MSDCCSDCEKRALAEIDIDRRMARAGTTAYPHRMGYERASQIRNDCDHLLTYVDSEGVRRLKAWDIVVPDDFDEDHARINYDFTAELERLTQERGHYQ